MSACRAFLSGSRLALSGVRETPACALIEEIESDVPIPGRLASAAGARPDTAALARVGMNTVDPFAATRARFHLPDGVLYLDGNSLGPVPHGVPERVAARIAEEWGERLIRGWNEAGWMGEPERVGARIGRLIGAWESGVTVGDTLSIRLFQALDAALGVCPDRRVVLSDSGNFPSDLYVAGGLLRRLGRGHSLKLVEPDALAEALDDSVAVLMLTHVDYRSGRLHDMTGLTRRAHAHGIPVVWDLAHSAGAVEVDLAACEADFAVGCTYKYLNGGPGSPAFIAVHPARQASVEPILAGWLGHAAPFAFERDYRPADGIGRLRVGTPPVLAMAALDAALDVWDEVSVADVRARSIELSERFVAELERRCPALRLASPREPHARGSQVSFAFEHGYAAMQALIRGHGVIGDFRAPDLMRFAFTPLYLSMEDVLAAVDRLEQVLVMRVGHARLSRAGGGDLRGRGPGRRPSRLPACRRVSGGTPSRRRTRLAGHARREATRMSEREIDDAITALRAEIERLDEDDPEDRERLETLVARLKLRLERREQGPVDEGATEILETLGARYPQVTLMINDIMTRLAAMGI